MQADDLEEEEEEEDMGASTVNTDFFDAVAMNPSFTTSSYPQMSPVHKGIGHPVLDRALMDDESVFVGRPLRSHPVHERNVSDTSVDSVAPPSIETSKAFGGKRSGRVGRLLWR